MLIVDREKGNMGGVNAFSFILEKQLAAPIDIIKGQATTIIASISDFISPDLVVNKSVFQEEKKGLNLFEYTFSGKIPRNDYNKLLDAFTFDAYKVIALVRDNNNEIRLLGQKGNGCELRLAFDKGVSPSDLNHVQIDLKWTSKHRAAVVPEIYIEPTQLQLEDGQFLEIEY